MFLYTTKCYLANILSFVEFKWRINLKIGMLFRISIKVLGMKTGYTVTKYKCILRLTVVFVTECQNILSLKIKAIKISLL